MGVRLHRKTKPGPTIGSEKHSAVPKMCLNDMVKHETTIVPTNRPGEDLWTTARSSAVTTSASAASSSMAAFLSEPVPPILAAFASSPLTAISNDVKIGDLPKHRATIVAAIGNIQPSEHRLL